jgi:DinB superfamily
MQEEPKEYQKRIMGYAANSEPMQILGSTVEKLKSFASNANSETWKQKAAGDGWTAADVFAHFAEGEIVLGTRIRMIAGTDATPIQAFDQDAWVANADYLRSDPNAALELFSAVRKANIAFLKSLSPDRWNHYGMHTERGKETLHDVVRMYAGHDLNHLKQLDKLR